MAESTPVIINAAAMALPFARQFPVTCDMAQVIDNAKVSDHHAIIPTMTVQGFDLSTLPAGEHDILILVIVRLICAVGEAHRAAETTITVDCGGHSFTAKGKTVTHKGWKAADAVFRATLKGKPEEDKDAALPDIDQGEVLSSVAASIKEGKTSHPSISPKIRCCPRWKRRVRRIGPTMPSARGWERQPPVPVFLKSW